MNNKCIRLTGFILWLKHAFALTSISAKTIYVDDDTQGANIPLLGFSLGIIVMDDQNPSPQNEFDIRVSRRLNGPQDEPTTNPQIPLRGVVHRLNVEPNVYSYLIKKYYYVAMITALAQNPNDGMLYITDFSGPQHQEDIWQRHWDNAFFTSPVMTQISSNNTQDPIKAEVIENWPQEGTIPLPLSMVWTGRDRESANQDPAALQELDQIDVKDRYRNSIIVSASKIDNCLPVISLPAYYPDNLICD